jgi:O-antigen biosynthesis protein
MMADVEDSVVVMMCTYNRLDLTKRMLKDFCEKTKHPCTLVIVDDGSADGTREYLKTISEIDEFVGSNVEIEVYENHENLGVAKTRNRALKIAVEKKPKFFCTVDNDVELPEGWLGECIDILKANRNFGCIGANMEGRKYPLVTKGGFTFQEKGAGNLGTACMVFPSAVQKMLGFFNTEYGKYGEEDADFGMRVRVAGFRLGYIERMGHHFGEGELDVGEYRDFKTACNKNNLAKFKANCVAYARKQKSLYIPYRE